MKSEKTKSQMSVDDFIADLRARGPRKGRRSYVLDTRSVEVEKILEAGFTAADIRAWLLNNEIKVSISTVYKYLARRRARLAKESQGVRP